MKKTIMVVTRDAIVTEIINNILSNNYEVVILGDMQSAVTCIYNSIPNLLIVDISMEKSATLSSLNNLKDDPLFRQIPVFAIFPDQFTIPDWNLLFIEDYVRRSDFEHELQDRISLTILRSERIVEISPLTRLPGNISICRQIDGRLQEGQEFALGYTDIDHFKPFNDTYGFLLGDDIIKITARLILNIVKNTQPQDSFVGHIGGDDFIFIMKPDLVEEAAQGIVRTFDSIMPTFYNADDREKGYIFAHDRQGKEMKFPLISISIGITDTVSRKFAHYGDVTEAASEMKKYAKQFQASCYRWDKRHDVHEP